MSHIKTIQKNSILSYKVANDNRSNPTQSCVLKCDSDIEYRIEIAFIWMNFPPKLCLKSIKKLIGGDNAFIFNLANVCFQLLSR